MRTVLVLLAITLLLALGALAFFAFPSASPPSCPNCPRTEKAVDLPADFRWVRASATQDYLYDGESCIGYWDYPAKKFYPWQVHGWSGTPTRCPVAEPI